MKPLKRIELKSNAFDSKAKHFQKSQPFKLANVIKFRLNQFHAQNYRKEIHSFQSKSHNFIVAKTKSTQNQKDPTEIIKHRILNKFQQ